MSFNNKINRLAQTSKQDSIKSIGVPTGQNIPQTGQQNAMKNFALQTGGSMAVSNVKENVPENLMEYGAKKGLEKFAPKLMQSVPKPNPVGLANLAKGGAGAVAGFGLEAGLSLAEEMQGPKVIFNNYYQDYVKLLNALASEFPQNQELQNMVNLGKQIGQKTHQIMMTSKVQGPTLGKAVGTGIQSAKDQASGFVDLGKMAIGQQPTTATYNHKMQRLAIVGEANLTDVGRKALVGTVGGGLAGGLPGAAIGAAVGAGVPIMQNIYHHTRSDAYQSAAYTNQLKEKGYTLTAQLAKVDPQAAQMLEKYINDLDIYVKQKIYKGGGTAFEKGIDAVTKFFTKEKDQEVDQSTVDQANSMAQQPQSQQQEMSGQNSTSQEQPAENSPEQDQNIQVGVQQIMDIYNEGMQYYNAGNLQAYNQYKMQYNQAIQTITNYIAQKYPDQDPNAMLEQIMQQQQAQQQQMQQPQ
jgi:hypothetical protein